MENDNPLRSCHIRHEANLRPTVRYILSASVLLLGGLPLFPTRAAGQGAPNVAALGPNALQSDATVLPRHTFGVRVLAGFSRWTDLIGTGDTRNIASSLVVDSVTPAQVSQLSTTQTSIRTLTQSNAFNVTAGRITASADSRVVSAPLILEFGLTNRLTLGVVVPLVETRTTFGGQLNGLSGAPANVGANPGGSNWAVTASLAKSFRDAAIALKARLTSCQTTPTGAGCTDLLANQTAVQALIDQTAPFASALETLYGVSASQPGTFFIPIQGSPTQLAVNARIAALRTSYASFNGTVADVVPAGSTGPAANNAFQNLLLQAGYDSLQSTDRSSIGDVTVGATFQLANTFGDSVRMRSGSMLYRVSANAGFRFGTGQPAQRNLLFDNATGYGQNGIIVGGAADLRFTRRVFLSALGSFTKQLGSVDVNRVNNPENNAFPLTLPALGSTYSAGDVATFTAIPRYRLGGSYAIDGVYTVTHIGSDQYTGGIIPPASPIDPLNVPIGTSVDPNAAGASSATTQQIGLGITYSASLNDRNPGRFPYEVSFHHMELVSASGGPVAKSFTDVIQLRVFFR